MTPSIFMSNKSLIADAFSDFSCFAACHTRVPYIGIDFACRTAAYCFVPLDSFANSDFMTVVIPNPYYEPEQ